MRGSNELPCSTSPRISISISVIDGLPCPRATISNACISGRPALIIVDSWRVKTVMSSCVILRLELVFTRVICNGRMPRFASFLRASSSVNADTSPLTSLSEAECLPSKIKRFSFFANKENPPFLAIF